MAQTTTGDGLDSKRWVEDVMNCKRAQFDIALMAGGDLDAATERELNEHLAVCAPCQAHWNQMQHALPALLEREDHPVCDPLHDSVWPDLQVRLPRPLRVTERSQFNGWIVGVALCGVCLAMVSVWNTAQRSSDLNESLDGAGLVDADYSAADPSRREAPAAGPVPPGSRQPGFTPVLDPIQPVWPPATLPLDRAAPRPDQQAPARFPQGTGVYVRFPDRHRN